MIPRAPQCDDDRCDYTTTGHWTHHPQCATHNPQAGDDMAASTAREDGYSLPYGMVVRLPGQWKRGAA